MFSDEETASLETQGAESVYGGMTLDALYACLRSDLEPWTVSDGPWSPIEPKVCAAKLLLESFLKKYEYSSPEQAEQAALKKFLSVNERCRNYKLNVEGELDSLLIGELKNFLYLFCNPTQEGTLFHSLNDIFCHGKTGPGASRGANGKDFYSKFFSSPLTTTSAGLYKAYRNYTSTRPSWDDAEELRSDHYGPPCVVSGNKLTFVPKNVDIARVICVEPSLNMYFQLGVKHILEQRLSQVLGLDISRPSSGEAPQQEKNRALAELGSMFERSWVTIDLSSASDSLAMGMLDRIFPSNFLDWLKLFRSPHSLLPDGSELELSMISTMGNGYTFPLQTILFSGIVVAAHRIAGIRLEKPRGSSLGNFGVYGDDIICRHEVVPYVFRLLELLGFTLNSDKTFVEGPFRESCGGDYFEGHQVRGVYLSRLTTLQDVYVAINTLVTWSARNSIPLFRTLRYLYKHVPKSERIFVPLAENADAGIRVPRSFVNSRLLVDPNIQSVKYNRYIVRPPKIRITDSEVLMPGARRKGKGRRRLKHLLYNPSGLFLAFLNGNIRDSSISVRHDRNNYHLKEAYVPYWDYMPGFASVALAKEIRRMGYAVSQFTG